MKLFKVKTNYLKEDKSSDNGSSNASEVRLFEAVDYVDAQTQAIKLVNENGCLGECDVDIQKVSYDEVLDKEGEEIYYYEVRVSQMVVNDKDEEKIISKKYIVAGEDLEDALDVVREHLKEEDEDSWWFTNVSETPIEEIVLLNLNIE